MSSCSSIDLITNTEVSGTTSTLLGSARIISGDFSNFEFRAMMGTTTFTTASLEVKRFTGGTSVTTIEASGSLQDISSSVIAIPADDWYEFYLSGSNGSTISLVKGIRVTLS